jgi:2'-hydroxyisoflavone reductase
VKLLIIGGTKFLGPQLVRSALERGHEVTLFNRGLFAATPPAGVEFVQGNRDGEIGRLAGRRFDAAIDTCGFVPRVVRESVVRLADAIERYIFVSSISVYTEPLGGSFAEEEPTAVPADPAAEDVTNETYGGLKALCEREVMTGMPGRTMVVRPGLIVGPLDPSDRFTYWPTRFALGGDVLVPGAPEADVSFIDVRDLAQWVIHAAEGRLTGTFNASGTHGATTMGEVIEACRNEAGTGRAVWVSEDFVLSHGVAPWTELPLWIPQGEDSLIKASSARAVAAALRYRPLAETVQATLEWSRGLGLDRPLRAGLTRARETELLTAWSSAAR